MLSINQEDPHDEDVCNPNCVNFLLLHLRIFADLIIEEAVGLPSSNHPFLQVYIAPLMPQRLDDQGNNVTHILETQLQQTISVFNSKSLFIFQIFIF